MLNSAFLWLILNNRYVIILDHNFGLHDQRKHIDQVSMFKPKPKNMQEI